MKTTVHQQAEWLKNLAASAVSPKSHEVKSDPGHRMEK
jgi:hypothetical protein